MSGVAMAFSRASLSFSARHCSRGLSQSNASLISTATAAQAHLGKPARLDAWGGPYNGSAPDACAGHVGARLSAAAVAVTGVAVAWVRREHLG